MFAAHVVTVFRMVPVRRAVIDVGTNSVKLLIAEVQGAKVRPLWEGSDQTRLGKGLFTRHMLDPEAIAATVKTIATFSDKARAFGVTSTRAIATSAARDAKNAGDLVAAVKQMAGLDLQVISGEDEALFAYQGVLTDDAFGVEPVLVVDLGGGSTEMVLGSRGGILFSGSFKIGTVRLLELVPHSDPPRREELAACREWVRRVLDQEVVPRVRSAFMQLSEKRFQLVGTGGTATILGCIYAGLTRFDRARLDGLDLPFSSVRELTERLWSLPLAARREVNGLPAERADVMLTGSAIYEGIMESLGCPCLRISTRGLRFAAALDGAAF